MSHHSIRHDQRRDQRNNHPGDDRPRADRPSLTPAMDAARRAYDALDAEFAGMEAQAGLVGVAHRVCNAVNRAHTLALARECDLRTTTLDMAKAFAACWAGCVLQLVDHLRNEDKPDSREKLAQLMLGKLNELVADRIANDVSGDVKITWQETPEA